MKLRKLMALTMAGVMALSLAACGGGGETAETEAGGAATEAEGGEEAGGEATDETKRIAYVVGRLQNHRGWR